MKKYILSIDQGTTSSRAILFDENGNNCFMAQREVECIFPNSGWVECDPLNIYISVTDVISEVLIKANCNKNSIDSFAITNQRETTIVWDKKSGIPVYNAIVWQSRQSNDICENLMDKKEFIHERTGLIINPYFSASKIRFILDHIENGQERAEKGELLFGTVDSWLIYKLTGGNVHATDVTNASRTLLFNINDMKWDADLCKLFNIRMCMLPEAKPCCADFGKISVLPTDVHIEGVAGDQQAALFGQLCTTKGECKNTYGTGCFMLMNIGDRPTLSNNGLLTTVAWQIGDKPTYALEGSVYIGGAVVQWLRDEMKFIETSGESEYRANLCKDTGGIYIVPAFTGLGTPYWDNDVRGAVFGLTRNTNKNQFIRASLESIAYQCKDVFQVMEQESGIHIKAMKVDGGASANKFLMQFQSDILQTSIKLPKCLETTALGAAYFAGLHSGFFKSVDDIKKCHEYQAKYFPMMDEDDVNRHYNGWISAINAARAFKK